MIKRISKRIMSFVLAFLMVGLACFGNTVFAESEETQEQTNETVANESGSEALGIGGDENITIPVIKDSFGFRASSGTSSITTGISIQYDVTGLGNGIGWGTRYFNLHHGDKTYIAYCLEPTKTYPLSGVYAYQQLTSNEGLAKALYYAHGSLGESEYLDTLGLDGPSKYIISHCVAAYFYGDADWNYGLNSTGIAYCNGFIDFINNQPSPPTSAHISLSSSALTAVISGNEQKTNIVTLNGDTRNYITVNLQTGVTLHNLTKGTTATGSVKVYGGDSFYLTSPLNLTLTQESSWSSGDIAGSMTHTFSPLIFNIGNDVQVLGSYSYVYDPGDAVSFSVKWLELGKIKIVKTSEDGIVAGLKFKITGNGVNETATTGSDGTIEIDNLVPGNYTITEVSTPDRYVQPESKEVTVESGKTATVSFDNILKKFNVSVTKMDSDTGLAQGSATLAGAVYGIYKDGELLDEYTTDENGQFTTDYYICGTGWTLKEIIPSKGYLLDDKEYPIGAEPGNFTVELNPLAEGVTEEIIRGDLKGIKVSDGDMKRMSGVPFKITSVTTGESHIIVTDENGQFDTSSSWNPHSQNTNKGETADDGIWFGDGDVNDDLGALIYDTYLIEELPCEANEGMVILEPFQVNVSRNLVTVDLGTITNDYVPQPEIGTTATWKDGGKEITAQPDVTLVDKVEYINLTAGREYTLSGVLMDKSTGKELLIDGKTVTATAKFTPEKANGSVELEFTFDASTLGGKEIVVFEKVLYEEEEVAAHEDIDDEGQTVKVVEVLEPRIGTTATWKDGGKEITAQPDVALVDTVEYENLTVGREYTLSGVLMDKSTGKELLIDGKTVTATAKFTPEKANGSVELEFTFDASTLGGKEIVVFEKVLYEEEVVAAHEDIDDEGQTVKVVEVLEPRIGTTATWKDGGKEIVAQANVTLVDKVEYENLTVGREYTLSGVLMDKSTGKGLLIDGKTVTATAKFTPEKANGSVELEFTFDASTLGGKEIVVFEKVLYEEEVVAAHKDIDDEGQTVKVKAEQAKTEQKTNATKTGDSSNLLTILILMAVSACAVGIVVYKRKKVNR